MSRMGISRDDNIYLEVENFKDYELTQCIAFEMMLRNNEFINDRAKIIFTTPIMLIALEDDNNLKKEIISSLSLEVSKFIINELEKGHTKKAAQERYDLYKLLEKKWGIKINDIMNADVQDNLFLYDMNLLYMDDKSIDYDLKKDEKVDFNNKITTKFQLALSRPRIEYPNHSKIAQIELNLSLPKSELVAIISKIKDIADSQEIITPIELLGDELQIADNLVCDTKGKCFDAREVLSKQQKMADMFYIYDCLQLGTTQRKIQTQIYNYYADLGIETKTMDFKTLKKYKEIAVDYIDNMRYKELVTGSKIN